MQPHLASSWATSLHGMTCKNDAEPPVNRNDSSSLLYIVKCGVEGIRVMLFGFAHRGHLRTGHIIDGACRTCA